MDTIIYLYHSEEAENYRIEIWREKEYCLIRLGIPMLLWKNLKSVEERKVSEYISELPIKNKWLDKRKHKRKRQQLESFSQEKQIVSEEPKLIWSLLAELAELQKDLCILGENPQETYCVLEDFLKEKIDTRIWWEHWTLPEFGNYRERIWAEELMKYAKGDAFLILGTAACVEEILEKYGAGMRNVKWVLKPKQYTEAVEECVDWFYEEFGLAVSLELLEENEGWIHFRPSSATPVNVLDFTGVEKLFANDVSKGSIWLDMDSLSGKERRFESRCPQITYFSLKKHWKHLEKAPFYLDTTGENRYNT